MPKQTFMNLAPDRQREIIDCCLEEFVSRDYRDASLTRIIEQLGLAKGSFYRYFNSKRELYDYLVEYAGLHTLKLYEEIFAEPVDDVLDAWVRFFLACAEQDNAYPLLGYFGYRITRERDNVALGDVPRRTLERGFELLARSFRTQQERGTVRPDVEVEKLIFVLLQVQNGFLDYLSIVHKIDFEDNVRSGRPLFTIPVDALRKELESFVELMRYGFAAPMTPLPGGST